MANSFLVNYGSFGHGDNATRWQPLAGAIFLASSVASTESFLEQPIRDAGTMSKFFVYVPTNTASVTSVITVRKSIADTAITVSYTTDAFGIQEDTTNTATYAATDEIDIQVTVPTESGTNTLSITVTALQFAPDTTANCVSMMAVSASDPSFSTASSTQYFGPMGVTVLTATQADTKYRLRQEYVASSFFVNCRTNARTTNTVFGIQKNGASTGQTVTFGNAEAGQKINTTNSDALGIGDDVNYAMTTGTGTGAIRPMNLAVRMNNLNTVFPMVVGEAAGVSIAANTTRYTGVSGQLSHTSNETQAQVYPRFTFTAYELETLVKTNAATISNCTVNLRTDAGNSALTIAIPAAGIGLRSDTTNTVTVTSGTTDIDYRVFNADLVGAVTMTWIGMQGYTTAPSAVVLVHGFNPSGELETQSPAAVAY
jgi:hypothetical protein